MRQKTTVTEFINELENSKIATNRLLTILKRIKEHNYFIEDITPKEMGRFRGLGKKTKEELITLIKNYTEQQDNEKGYNKMSRKELIQRIRELEYVINE
jgi:N-acetylmuramoyl-L-alanine amidase CwlA